MKMKKIVLALCLLPMFAVAGNEHSDMLMPEKMMDAHEMNHVDNPQDAPPYAIEYEKANAEMHKGMNIQYTLNPDVDFVKGMIAHHQGAVEMAKIQLKYGKDPEMLTFAQSIIDAQNQEIDKMKEWLQRQEKSE